MGEFFLADDNRSAGNHSSYRAKQQVVSKIYQSAWQSSNGAHVTTAKLLWGSVNGHSKGL